MPLSFEYGGILFWVVLLAFYELFESNAGIHSSVQENVDCNMIDTDRLGCHKCAILRCKICSL